MTDLHIENAHVVDIPEEEYHATSGIGDGLWVTRSIMSDYRKSAAGCKLRHVDRNNLCQVEQTPSLTGGTYFDILITEGREKFDRTFSRPPYIAAPESWFRKDGSVRTAQSVQDEIAEAIRAGHVFEKVKASIDAWKERNPGVRVRNEEHYARSLHMYECLMRNPVARIILEKNSQSQLTIRAHINGLPVQIRADLFSKVICSMSDIKTSSKTASAWSKDVFEYGYDIQGTLYPMLGRELFDIRRFDFVVQMSKWPFDSYVQAMTDDLRFTGELAIAEAIDGIKAEQWGEYPDKPEPIELPGWLARQHGIEHTQEPEDLEMMESTL